MGICGSSKYTEKSTIAVIVVKPKPHEQGYTASTPCDDMLLNDLHDVIEKAVSNTFRYKRDRNLFIDGRIYDVRNIDRWNYPIESYDTTGYVLF
jgi:hypothetical protein